VIPAEPVCDPAEGTEHDGGGGLDQESWGGLFGRRIWDGIEKGEELWGAIIRWRATLSHIFIRLLLWQYRSTAMKLSQLVSSISGAALVVMSAPALASANWNWGEVSAPELDPGSLASVLVLLAGVVLLVHRARRRA
jgi:hypothetical protein